MRRQPKGSRGGGQFAPDTRGATPPSTGHSTVAPGAGETTSDRAGYSGMYDAVRERISAPLNRWTAGMAPEQVSRMRGQVAGGALAAATTFAVLAEHAPNAAAPATAVIVGATATAAVAQVRRSRRDREMAGEVTSFVSAHPQVRIRAAAGALRSLDGDTAGTYQRPSAETFDTHLRGPIQASLATHPIPPGYTRVVEARRASDGAGLSLRFIDTAG